MFFTKLILPAVALVGAVFASPMAMAGTELAKRGGSDPVLTACQNLYDSCSPLMTQLTPTASVDVIASVVVEIQSLFVAATAALKVDVGVDIDVDVVAIVNVIVELYVTLIVALSACVNASASIYATVDVFLSAFLTVLANIDVDLIAQIGQGCAPLLVNIEVFVTLKLVLTATILGLLSIL
ncbi:hypothetical protein EUX98_g8055 [Antrodiella citrinella]|uniref:Transmembrane protein n=1 Tax=Antrodiella citrinella TaxID=2447956 RepID=A0A4S4MCI6_9APHY|nr:hypothetical protein EUX98_g8055 [Antrodiella citrinella]